MTLLSAKSSVVGRTASRARAVVQPCSLVAARPHAVARRQRQLRAAADAGTATTAAVASVADMPEELLALVLDDSRPEGSTTTRSSNSSSSGGSDGSVGMVRVGAETDPARVAGYMRSRFDENGDDFTIILQALGAPACAQALKAVSRLQRRLAEDDAAAAGRCVVFRTQSTRLRLEERPQEKHQQGDGDAKLATASQLVVRLGPRSDWPDAAFRAERPQGSQGTDDKDASEEPQSRSKDSSSSSSSSDGAAAARCIPTLVRPDDDPQKERQRLKGHALRAAARQLPAQFVLSGNRARLANSALQLLAAVGAARRAALSSDEPFDLQCTIASSTYTVTRDPSRSSQSSQAKTESAPKADADSSAAAGAAGAESEPAGEAGAAADADAAAAAAAGESSTLTRTRYLVTVQRCEPSRNALAAARKWAEAAAGRGGSSARPRPTRPGFVEVREEEWNQLREQLAVVPHLTEQLQIMTRQHEQLLSLLAAQQGQQQEDQAA